MHIQGPCVAVTPMNASEDYRGFMPDDRPPMKEVSGRNGEFADAELFHGGEGKGERR